MSMKRNISVLALVLSLSACATYQENPNYQYSSKYDPQSDPIVLAEQTALQQYEGVPYTTTPVSQSQTIIASSPTQTSPYTEQTYTGQAYTDQTYTSQSSVTSQTPHSAYPQSAPTDTAYAGQTLEGTPGYGIYQPEAVEYDYSDNIVSTGVQVPEAAYQSRDVGLAPTTPQQVQPALPYSVAAGYTVRQGDTVYSLARKLCVGVHEISGANNLGADFGIKIGQNLSLPASRC